MKNKMHSWRRRKPLPRAVFIYSGPKQGAVKLWSHNKLCCFTHAMTECTMLQSFVDTSSDRHGVIKIAHFVTTATECVSHVINVGCFVHKSIVVTHKSIHQSICDENTSISQYVTVITKTISFYTVSCIRDATNTNPRNFEWYGDNWAEMYRVAPQKMINIFG